MTDERSLQRRQLESLLEDHPGLLLRLLQTPAATLAEIGFEVADLQCPDAAHDAAARAVAAAHAGDDLEGDSFENMLPKLLTSMRTHLGTDVVVTKIPYGIQFA